MTEKSKKALTAAEILAADGRRKYFVEMPEIGDGDGGVFVRALSYGQMQEIRAGAAEDIGLQMVVAACVDEEGNTLFTADDIKALADVHMAAVRRLIGQVEDLCLSRKVAEKN